MSEKMYELLVKTVPKILPAICLISFLVFEAVWISVLVATVCFAYFYVVQVFVEQSRQWYNSTYLYVTLACAVFTWLEYQYNLLGRFLQ